MELRDASGRTPLELLGQFEREADAPMRALFVNLLERRARLSRMRQEFTRRGISLDIRGFKDLLRQRDQDGLESLFLLCPSLLSMRTDAHPPRFHVLYHAFKQNYDSDRLVQFVLDHSERTESFADRIVRAVHDADSECCFESVRVLLARLAAVDIYRLLRIVHQLSSQHRYSSVLCDLIALPNSPLRGDFLPPELLPGTSNYTGLCNVLNRSFPEGETALRLQLQLARDLMLSGAIPRDLLSVERTLQTIEAMQSWFSLITQQLILRSDEVGFTRSQRFLYFVTH